MRCAIIAIIEIVEKDPTTVSQKINKTLSVCVSNTEIARPFQLFTDNQTSVYEEATSFNILQSVSGIGAEVGELSYSHSRGQLVLNNSPHSMGKNKRFSDLLDRGILTNQRIQLELFEYADDADIVEDLGQISLANKKRIWLGRAGRITVAGGHDSRVTIELLSQDIPHVNVTQEVNINSYPDVPDDNIGKVLPIIIGTAETEGILIRQVVPTGAPHTIAPFPELTNGRYSEYAYATNTSYYFGASDKFFNHGVKKYYVKDRDNRYKEVVSASQNSRAPGATPQTEYTSFRIADMWYPLASNPKAQTEMGQIRSVNWTAKEHGHRYFNDARGVILTAISFRFFGFNADDYSVTCKVYDEDSNGYPNTLMTQTSRVKGQELEVYNAVDLTDSVIRETGIHLFVFPEPVILEKNKGFFFTLSGRCDVGGSQPIKMAILSDKAHVPFFRLYEDNTFENGWEVNNASTRAMQLFGMEFRDAPKGGFLSSVFDPIEGDWDDDSLTGSRFAVATGIRDYEFDLNRLDIVVSVGGLTPSDSELTSYHLETCVNRWKNHRTKPPITHVPYLNPLAFEQTHQLLETSGMVRRLSGKTRGLTNLKQLLTELCRNTASRLAPYRNPFNGEYNTGVWCWGGREQVKKVIDDEQAVLLNIVVGDLDSVINESFIVFSPNEITSSGRKRDLLERGFTRGVSGYWENEQKASRQLFDYRPLADNTFNWLPAVASQGANTVSKFFTAKYNTPMITVYIEVPMRDFWDLQLLDVVELILPEFFNEHGGSSNVNPPALDGETFIALSNYVKLAKKIRAQIVRLEYVCGEDKIPKMQLGLRLLDQNPSQDIT